MKFKKFKKLLDTLESIEKDFSDLSDLGFDFYEGKFLLSEKVIKMFKTAMLSTYTPDGYGWIEWFIYENDYGRKEFEATFNGELICQTLEDLYEFIEANHKL